MAVSSVPRETPNKPPDELARDHDEDNRTAAQGINQLAANAAMLRERAADAKVVLADMSHFIER
jgi:hypothetical protein